VEFISPEVDLGHLAVGDLDSGRIDVTVQSAGGLQSLLGFSGGNQVEMTSWLTNGLKPQTRSVAAPESAVMSSRLACA
jgi:hypothetical protein